MGSHFYCMLLDLVVCLALSLTDASFHPALRNLSKLRNKDLQIYEEC